MTQQANDYCNALQSMGPVRWAQGPNGWISDNGRPVHLAPWQAAALNAWWTNRLDVATFAISNVKKTGKTFTNAVLLAWRWLALPGLHFTCGNDYDQAGARQFQEIADMVRRNPVLEENCKVGKSELEFTLTGSRLVPLAVDATGNAGANFLTSSHTEAWGIVYEAGIRAYEELTPPPGRSYGLPAMRICDSYAGHLGESDTWHNLVDRGLHGDRQPGDWPIWKNGGLLLFHMTGEEARTRCFRGTPSDAQAFYQREVADLRPGTFTRMHANERSANEGMFLPLGTWESCYSQDVHADPGHVLVLGADASTSNDSTALVGCYLNDETGVIDVEFVKVWRPVRSELRGGRPTVDLAQTIGAEVLRLHAAGQVSAVYIDPYQLASLAVDWEKAGVGVVEVAQNSGRVKSDTDLYQAVMQRRIRHYNDPTLNEHIQNASAIETPLGMRLAKENAARKIDSAVALSMAHWGAKQMANTWLIS
jgi:phage terminase large subunit-like protein